MLHYKQVHNVVISNFFRHFTKVGPRLNGLSLIAITSFVVSISSIAARNRPELQSLELKTYDQMVQRMPDEGPDPRILIVEFTETDIRNLGTPLSDRLMARLLAQIQKHQPQVIGLDIFRDIPIKEGYQELATQLEQPNVIVIRQLDNEKGVPAPKNVPPKQIGFNDISSDIDGVIRRNILFAQDPTGKNLQSFSLRQAILYLKNKDITPEPSAINPSYLQLGKAVFIPLDGISGVYPTTETAGYQIILNYRSANNIAPKVTVGDVLEGKLDPELAKDKIVMIGSTAPSLRDNFFTPYSSANSETPKMFGVLVHAQMVSQILSTVLDNRPFIVFWPRSGEYAWIFFWSIIGGIIAWKCRHPALLIISIIIILSGLGFSCFTLLIINSVWVPVVSPIFAYLFTCGIVVTYRAYESQREAYENKKQQEVVMRLLGQNTSPEIAKALWNNRENLLQSGKLPGQKLIATMLFTDLKDFSTVSELMPPEKLMEWLNELLDVLTQEVVKYHGIVNKFTGDGIMAVFGVPISRNNDAEIAQDAENACACALAMGDRLQILNRDWQQRGFPVIQMRVGIYTGPIVAGSLGGKERLEYGVIGDSVNIASRLESCEKDRQSSICRVLIGQETMVYIQDKFYLEPWGPLALKGKQQMVEVYRVIARKSDADL